MKRVKARIDVLAFIISMYMFILLRFFLEKCKKCKNQIN